MNQIASPPLVESYRLPADQVLLALGTDAQRGLTTQEAGARLERFGPNELAAERPVPLWRRVLAQFQDVLVILLLVAALVSAGLWLAERDAPLPFEALAILVVVLLNALMGFVQQARAEQAVAALRRMSAAQASVMRDGERRSIAAADLVPGDVVLIEEGDTVSADARVIQCASLQMAEAPLTGESEPVLLRRLPVRRARPHPVLLPDAAVPASDHPRHAARPGVHRGHAGAWHA